MVPVARHGRMLIRWVAVARASTQNCGGADAVVESAQGALGLAVLSRGVWAGEAKGHPMILKKSAHGVVVKFTAVISLQGDNG